MSPRPGPAIGALLVAVAFGCRSTSESSPVFVALTSDLGHADASVRAAAAARLCELWPERRILPLLTRALVDVDDGVARAASVSLIRIGRPGLPGLLGGVRACSEAGWTSRAWYLAGLSLQLGPEAGDALKALATSQPK